MTFDRDTAHALHARVIESFARADEVDVDLVIDVIDLLPILADRVAHLEQRCAALEAANLAVGAM